uniref:ATPase family AAA domain containing 1a n=1 Tax=Astyanax mexicanus TaxID=7994 RepID=A0A3B1KB69_ASTMX
MLSEIPRDALLRPLTRNEVVGMLVRLTVFGAATYYSIKWVVEALDPTQKQKTQAKKRAEHLMKQIGVEGVSLNEYEMNIATQLVVPRSMKVTWRDVAGHDDIITELQDTVILPFQKRHLFRGSKLFQPPRGNDQMVEKDGVYCWWRMMVLFCWWGMINATQRQEILRLILSGENLSNAINLKEIAEKTEGYSGSDLRELCRDAAMYRVRDYVRKQQMKQIAQQFQLDQEEEEESLDGARLRPVTQLDLLFGLDKMKESKQATVTANLREVPLD